MTKQQTIQTGADSAVILIIPLEMLYISDPNPRRSVSEAHIETLADSIERFGLIHNLARHLEGGGVIRDARHSAASERTSGVRDRRKSGLNPKAIKATDHRARSTVGLEAYGAEGGCVTRGPFSDVIFLASPALLAPFG